jgi:hypothetical protein
MHLEHFPDPPFAVSKHLSTTSHLPSIKEYPSKQLRHCVSPPPLSKL